MRKVVVYGATRNLYPLMARAARSLLKTTEVDRVIFLTEDDKFPEELPEIIEIHNVKATHKLFFADDGINYRTHWTWMSLMRLALPFLFPDEDLMLWLDVDTVCVSDISAIFEPDLGDCYCAAVEEPERSKDPFVYVNTGVLLLNCKKLWDGKAAEIVSFANSELLTFPDQDAINLLCQGKIKRLSSCWNTVKLTESTKILHFAGSKGKEIMEKWEELQ